MTPWTCPRCAARDEQAATKAPPPPLDGVAATAGVQDATEAGHE